MIRKRVIIESPYAGDTRLNELYLRDCLHDSLLRGEAPLASHRMYTDVLDDKVSNDRELGIRCGYVWMEVADLVAFYMDRGMSTGMLAAKQEADLLGKPTEERWIDL
jgi:hypothetical protein